MIFLICLCLGVATTFTIEASGHPILNTNFDTLLIAGYAKCAISFVKYCPQVYLNYKRKSTVGWSLANVILDLTGGILSFIQIFLNAWALNESIIGDGAFNVVKFVLSIMSIIFDSIFLF